MRRAPEHLTQVPPVQQLSAPNVRMPSATWVVPQRASGPSAVMNRLDIPVLIALECWSTAGHPVVKRMPPIRKIQ